MKNILKKSSLLAFLGFASVGLIVCSAKAQPTTASSISAKIQSCNDNLERILEVGSADDFDKSYACFENLHTTIFSNASAAGQASILVGMARSLASQANLNEKPNKQDQYQQAIDLDTRALGLDGAAYLAFNNRAWAEQQLGKMSAAERDYVQALQINHEFIRSYNNLIDFYQTQNPSDSAKQTLLDIIQQESQKNIGDPGLEMAIQNLKVCLDSASACRNSQLVTAPGWGLSPPPSLAPSPRRR